MKSAEYVFDELFRTTLLQIEFNEDWLVGTYIELHDLPDKDINNRPIRFSDNIKMIDKFDRRVLIHSTLLGPIVVYEARSGKHLRHESFLYSAPDIIKESGLTPKGDITEGYQLTSIFGGVHMTLRSDNLNSRLFKIYKQIKLVLEPIMGY